MYPFHGIVVFAPANEHCGASTFTKSAKYRLVGMSHGVALRLRVV